MSKDPPDLSLGALYLGEVVHRRVRPRRHVLRYRVFSMLVDLDRLERFGRHLKLFSVNRANALSLHEKDFGPHDGSSVAAYIRGRALAAGLADPVAHVRMLAYPRIFGYAFNPLTVYFLEDAACVTRMIVYEVHNTFGERHFYDAVIDTDAAELQHELPKAFYVSPFNTIEGKYRFTIRPPADRVFTGIVLTTDDGPLLSAYFEGERRDLTDGQLLNVLLAYPFMTAKVLLGIHWEALLLWLKGIPLTLRFRRNLRDAGAARR
jgi:DUF1365 family protein